MRQLNERRAGPLEDVSCHTCRAGRRDQLLGLRSGVSGVRHDVGKVPIGRCDAAGERDGLGRGVGRAGESERLRRDDRAVEADGDRACRARQGDAVACGQGRDAAARSRGVECAARDREVCAQGQLTHRGPRGCVVGQRPRRPTAHGTRPGPP